MEFLRKIFGPSQAQIWSEVAQEIGADYEQGGFFKPSRVSLKYRNWTIILDTYTHTISTGKNTQILIYTRMRAPFVSTHGFRMKITRKGMLSWLSNVFSKKKITLGDHTFDAHFTVQGSPEDQVRSLVKNELIGQLIKSQKQIYFEIRDDAGWWGTKKFPHDVDLLCFQTSGVIKDKERLKGLFILFCLTLDELCQLDAASTLNPELNL